MNALIIIIAALLPVAILLFYIYRKDRLAPEPAGQLAKAFLFGVASVFVSFTMSLPFAAIGLYSETDASLLGSIRTAFFGAAIPEEVAKFAMLWLLLRRNKYFDEWMDGIVYAVCVSLGFAAFENVMYLLQYSSEFISVGIGRGLFAVPGHFCFGILMGYYFSLVKFYPHDIESNKLMVLAAPILAHGIYDSALMAANVSTALSVILTIAFLVFCHKLWKLSSRKIGEHIVRDEAERAWRNTPTTTTPAEPPAIPTTPQSPYAPPATPESEETASQPEQPTQQGQTPPPIPPQTPER